MDKLKLYEAMNLIDDDLVKEAAMPSDTVSEAKNGETTDPELTASGVEIYRRPRWQRFAAIASALLLIGGLSAAGGYYIKHRGSTSPDNDIIEEVATAPTTEKNGDKAEDTEVSSEVTSESSKKTTVTTSAADNSSEQPVIAVITASEGEKTPKNVTSAANRRVTTAKTTAKRSTGGTTTVKTTAAPEKTTAAVKPSVNGRMYEKDLISLAQNGDALTWKDFEPFSPKQTKGKVFIWEIPVYYDYPKADKSEQGYTLAIIGDINKDPDQILLLRGSTYTQTPDVERIDIRYDDVRSFLYPDAGLATALGTLKDCHKDFIRSIELISPMEKYSASLSYGETGELISMLQKTSFLKNEGGKWQALSTMYINIDITDNSSVVHKLRLQYPYLVIDNTGYTISDAEFEALYNYAASLLSSHQPSAAIDVSGVWCWHDLIESTGDVRTISESIRVSQLPDVILRWNGMLHGIEAYDNDGRRLGVTNVSFNAYLADINGDGYPELCTTYSPPLNRICIIEIAVWDIHNDKQYILSDIGKEELYDFCLYEENGELFVNKNCNLSAWHIFSRHGEKGKLGFEGDELVFVPV